MPRSCTSSRLSEARLDDAVHGGRCEIGQHSESDSPRPIITLFDGDQHGDRAAVFQLTTSGDARLRPANPGVIELDIAMERLAGRVDHGSSQFVEHHPGRFVASDSELTLDEQRRDTALVRGHQVGRPEPLRERRLRVVENRAGSQRDLMPALGALPAAVRDHVGSPMAAAWTAEAVGPATRRQVLLAGRLGSELKLKLAQARRKGRTRHALRYIWWPVETTG